VSAKVVAMGLPTGYYERDCRVSAADHASHWKCGVGGWRGVELDGWPVRVVGSIVCFLVPGTILLAFWCQVPGLTLQGLAHVSRYLPIPALLRQQRSAA